MFLSWCICSIYVGAAYRDVVHFCLSRITDSSPELGIATLQDFASIVTEPLEEFAEAPICSAIDPNNPYFIVFFTLVIRLPQQQLPCSPL